MGAPTNAASVKKVLANSEPSTHGGIATVATCESLLVFARIAWRPVTFCQRAIASVQQIKIEF